MTESGYILGAQSDHIPGLVRAGLGVRGPDHVAVVVAVLGLEKAVLAPEGHALSLARRAQPATAVVTEGKGLIVGQSLGTFAACLNLWAPINIGCLGKALDGRIVERNAIAAAHIVFLGVRGQSAWRRTALATAATGDEVAGWRVVVWVGEETHVTRGSLQDKVFANPAKARITPVGDISISRALAATPCLTLLLASYL